mgnify:CR=1 FL=1
MRRGARQPEIGGVRIEEGAVHGAAAGEQTARTGFRAADDEDFGIGNGVVADPERFSHIDRDRAGYHHAVGMAGRSGEADAVTSQVEIDVARGVEFHFDRCVAPGADLAQQLHAAVRNIDGEYKRIEIYRNRYKRGRTIPADPDVRNFSYALVNGQVYYRENSVMTRPILNQTTQERVKGMIELRDCVRKLIDLQLTDGSDAEIRAQQAELGRLYDAFSAEYGIINGKANGRAFEGDSSYYLLCSLEILDEDRKLKRKADIFSKRTIRRRKPVTQVDTASEALAVGRHMMSVTERIKKMRERNFFIRTLPFLFLICYFLQLGSVCLQNIHPFKGGSGQAYLQQTLFS